MLIVHNVEEVKQLINDNNFYIYGNGAVAKRFFHYLSLNKLEGHVLGFIVTCRGKDTKEERVPIYEVGKVLDKHLIIIAVDTCNEASVVSVLAQHGIDRYIYIYHYLFDLTFGAPLYAENVDVHTLIKENRYTSRTPAIYYLAIENYFGKNDIGDKLYIKHIASGNQSSSSLETAKRCLKIFHGVIEDCCMHGYHQKYNIKISENHTRILDGHHRLTLAKYFGVERIIADVYNWSWEKFKEYYPMRNRYYEDGSEKPLGVFFANDEVEFIEDAYSRMLDG